MAGWTVSVKDGRDIGVEWLGSEPGVGAGAAVSSKAVTELLTSTGRGGVSEVTDGTNEEISVSISFVAADGMTRVLD